MTMWNPFKKREGSCLPMVSNSDNVPVAEIIDPSHDNASIASIDGVVSQDLQVAEMCADTVNKALDVYKTSLLVEQNIAAIRSATDIKLAQISSQYNLCRAMLEQTFKERSQGLNAHYAVLDKAMESGDREMVIHALQGISSIVVSNPIEKFTEMVSSWNSYNKSNPLQLDF